MEKISYEKKIPLRYDVDVFIAGGGPAGIAASLAAARQGKEVMLVESQSCLGGLGTAGLVPAFMKFGDGVNFLSGGIGREVLNNLRNEGGTGFEDSQEREHTSIAIKPEVLKRVYDRLLEEAGVNFLFNTTLIDVQCQAAQIDAVICAAKSGIFAVKASAYIDCSGDGDLAVWAGAPFEKGDEEGEMMAGTLCSLWSGINFKECLKMADADTGPSEDCKRKPTCNLSTHGINPAARLEDAMKDKVLSQEDYHLSGMWFQTEHIAGANIGHEYGVDATDERSLTEALVNGRQRTLEYEKYYKQYLKGYEHMELVATGNLMGIRESRRIMGDYVLNIEDFKKRACFEDEVGRYCFFVDLHCTRPGKQDHRKLLDRSTALRYKKGESYGVPYRCLVPRELNNLLVAGRCISTDRYMQGSLRVMPGCYITGQAAGVASALMSEQRCHNRDIPIQKLQDRLLKMGAYLPNALK